MKHAEKLQGIKYGWKKALALVLAVGVLTGCGSKSGSADESTKKSSKSQGTIVVGGKTFTEGFLVSELYSLALENAGYTVDRQYSLSTQVLQDSLLSGEVDLYPEYTGTGLMTVLGEDALTDPQEVYDTVKKEYKDKYNLVWLDSSEVNDSTCIVMLRDKAEELGIENLSDLNKHAPELTLATFEGWAEREDNLPAMNKIYGEFKFKDTVNVDSGLKYSALDNGEADVIPGLTTEANLSDDKYVVITEDKKVWPPYYLAPVVRQETLDEHADIEEILNNVSASLDNETIISLISKVEKDGEDYEDVAYDFFNENLK